MTLDKASVSSLKGVGPALTEKLERLGITNLQDVLFHLPLRYEDRTRITPIASLQAGHSVVIEGEITASNITFGRRRSLLVQLQDSTGLITLRFFHFNNAQKNSLHPGQLLRCFGEVRRGAAGLEIYHPEYSSKAKSPLPDRLTAVYPTTEGISQLKFRSLVTQVLALMDKGEVLIELIPAELNVDSYLNVDLNQSLRLVHNPPPDIDLSDLLTGKNIHQQRLAFEELLAHQFSRQIAREELMKLHAPALAPPGQLYQQLQNSLGFRLTGAQQRVATEIVHDLGKPTPTLRLIQGDVGSGKTVIAAMAMTHAVENNYQAVLMAPTEILAEQHLATLSAWLQPLGIKIAWLSGKVKGKQRTAQLAAIASGEANVIVGTHALFQQDVIFNQLGLVIVDEQHRFGVQQRMALKDKGSNNITPHQLTMTATPIPRTLTMSLYADMQCSAIDELPPGRTPVTTTVLQENRRDAVIGRVASACKEGAQAYWVCTLIEESEVLECQAAEATAAQLAQSLKGLKVALIHGQMQATEKAETMASFKAGDIDLLVATTVIEVGVDVPNANLMIIENSERLGLAQLHQLRGRIGRGNKQSHCLLLYKTPLGKLSQQRLNVMRDSNDGFYIAEQDLLIRGPGELLGSKQSGSLQFRIADLVRDHQMLEPVSRCARTMLANHRDQAKLLMDRWITSAEEFSQV